MSDQLESTGKTVDEAIREALLRMGLRREEVDVTVVQEARSGILGVGRRQAVVKVSKKTGGGQQARGRRDAASDGNRRGRGQQAGERLDSGRGGRSSRSDERRGGRGRGGARVEARETREAPGQDGRDDRESKDSRDGRGGRGRGGRGGARRGDQPAGEETRSAATTQDAQRDQAASAAREDDQSAAASDNRSRRRRPRRRRKKSETEGQQQVAQANGPAQSDEREAAAPVIEAVAVEQPVEKSPAGDVSDPIQVTTTTPTSQPDAVESAGVDPADADAGQPVPDQMEAPVAQPAAHDADGGKVLAADVAASARIAPLTAEEVAELPSFLQRVATELMVKSGFPCRVQVIEGEYHLVKLVVDDRSAGVLIGRYGNTVDAVEYLVEKLASKAAGDRVRMNLDINNYRLRREDQLVQRARNAAAEARNTGEPVSMEPAAGRERRIVHLYIQDTGDLTTYTEDHPDGKYVVICRPDQVPEQHRHSGSDEDNEPAQAEAAAPVEAEIEVSAVIDVETGHASRNEAERPD